MGIKELFKRIIGVESLEETIEHQHKIIQQQASDYIELFRHNSYVANLQKECNSKNSIVPSSVLSTCLISSIIDELKKEVNSKNEEIKQVERTLEGTIDQQYAEIQKLRTQLEHATNNKVGKFYVFNPQHGQPRKIYDSYEAAMKDAESVAKISKGQKVLVLKIVSGVQISENYEDYSLIPEEEIPF